MASDPRLKFLSEEEQQKYADQYDFVHIDYQNGKQVIKINSDATYHRIMFNFIKGDLDDVSQIYVTSLVFSLRYTDGMVNFVTLISSIYKTYEEAEKEIKEEFEHLKQKPDLELGYYDIVIDNIYRGYVDLSCLDHNDLTDYDLIDYKIELCEIIR